MDVEFRTAELLRCFEDVTLGERNWSRQAAQKYVRTINIIYNARSWAELYKARSLRLHKLRGEKRKVYAIVLHDAWRIELIPSKGNAVLILEVNYHYGD